VGQASQVKRLGARSMAGAAGGPARRRHRIC
jgi:hypothetical protein